MSMDWVWRRLTPIKRLESNLRRLHDENARLRADLEAWRKFSPPGHFDSPLPSAEEAADAWGRLEDRPTFQAIDLNAAEQLALLESFASMYPEQPFPAEATPGFRYYLNNGSYARFDGIMLYCMLRHLQPARIVEVGSGFSSAAMLDLNERGLGGRIQFTFIDPTMARLRPLLREGDLTSATLIERRVQDVPLDVFEALQERDVLFIDSSHVSKVGSDVNHLFFEVLPRLRPGVRVHIHDIASRFEYPREWIEHGRAWNEQYLLRAFLMYNDTFKIELWASWLSDVRHEYLQQRMPLCAQGGGGQIWLRKER